MRVAAFEDPSDASDGASTASSADDAFFGTWQSSWRRSFEDWWLTLPAAATDKLQLCATFLGGELPTLT